MEDLTGRSLGERGKYVLLRRLGGGGFGAVYEAEQAGLRRRVAIKVLDPALTREEAFVRRFHREAEIVARLDHPNILPVSDFGEQDGLLYLVMRLVRGGSVKDRLRAAGRPFTAGEVLALSRQVLPALDYAHRHGVLHRDMKPDNMLLEPVEDDGPDGPGYRAYLADFGIAKVAREGAEESEGTLTEAGMSLGTPAYMAPEQVMGLALDGRADLYAYGVILYEALTGRVPFHGPTPMGTAVQHLQGSLPPPRSVNPALPEPVEAVLVKALAREPGDRYQTGAALVAALAEAAAASTAPVAIPAPVPVRPGDEEGETVRVPTPTFNSTTPAAVEPSPDPVSPDPVATEPVTERDVSRQRTEPVRQTAAPASRRGPSPLLLAGGGLAALLVAGGAAFALTRPGPTPAPPSPTPSVAVVAKSPSAPAATNVAVPPSAAPAAKTAGAWEVVAGREARGTPRGVAVDAAGNVYVADAGGRVAKIGPAGEMLSMFSTIGPRATQTRSLQGIAVGPAGFMLIADDDDHQVLRMSPTGEPAGRIGTGQGSGAGQLDSPAGVAVDTQSGIYVTELGNHRVQRFSPNGQPVGSAGTRGSGPGQFEGPSSVAVDGQGNVFVADTGNHRIQKLTPSGEPLAQWGGYGSGPGQFNLPRGVAVDGQGNVYVADTANHRVQKLSPTGAPLQQWGGRGTEPGQFDGPYRLAVDGRGALYVADGGNSRLQRLAAP